MLLTTISLTVFREFMTKRNGGRKEGKWGRDQAFRVYRRVFFPSYKRFTAPKTQSALSLFLQRQFSHSPRWRTIMEVSRRGGYWPSFSHFRHFHGCKWRHLQAGVTFKWRKFACLRNRREADDTKMNSDENNKQQNGSGGRKAHGRQPAESHHFKSIRVFQVVLQIHSKKKKRC